MSNEWQGRDTILAMCDTVAPALPAATQGFSVIPGCQNKVSPCIHFFAPPPPVFYYVDFKGEVERERNILH